MRKFIMYKINKVYYGISLENIVSFKYLESEKNGTVTTTDGMCHFVPNNVWNKIIEEMQKACQLTTVEEGD